MYAYACVIIRLHRTVYARRRTFATGMTLVMVKAVIILFLVTLSSFRLTSGRLSFAQTAAEQQELVVHYANTWAVEVRGGTEEANELALKHGLINRGQVSKCTK